MTNVRNPQRMALWLGLTVISAAEFTACCVLMIWTFIASSAVLPRWILVPIAAGLPFVWLPIVFWLVADARARGVSVNKDPWNSAFAYKPWVRRVALLAQIPLIVVFLSALPLLASQSQDSLGPERFVASILAAFYGFGLVSTSAAKRASGGVSPAASRRSA